MSEITDDDALRAIQDYLKAADLPKDAEVSWLSLMCAINDYKRTFNAHGECEISVIQNGDKPLRILCARPVTQ